MARLCEHAAAQQGRPARLVGQRLARPAITYLFLGLYAQARLPADPRRYGQARALATLGSLIVNVITI